MEARQVVKRLITSGPRKSLCDLFLQLQHRHFLKLLIRVAQVDHHLLPPQPVHNYLVDLSHFCAVCGFFLCVNCCTSSCCAAQS